jgi:hypothetical protein
MEAMKPVGHPLPIVIPEDIAAKCDGPNQFDTFDRGVRAFLAVPKSAVLKDEAKQRRKRKKAAKR